MLKQYHYKTGSQENFSLKNCGNIALPVCSVTFQFKNCYSPGRREPVETGVWQRASTHLDKQCDKPDSICFFSFPTYLKSY